MKPHGSVQSLEITSLRQGLLFEGGFCARRMPKEEIRIDDLRVPWRTPNFLQGSGILARSQGSAAWGWQFGKVTGAKSVSNSFRGIGAAGQS
jgi:hypothetical protein